MTLIEAIKTGKRFRRIGDDRLFFEVRDFIPCAGPAEGRMVIRKDDLLAEDWETETKEAVITRESFMKVYYIAQAKDSISLSSGVPRLHLLLQELGLE